MPRIAARDGRAVEGGVDLVLVQVQPATQCVPRPAAPRSALLSLDDAGRLAVHVGPLAEMLVEYGERLERIARLDAGAADSQVSLQRGEGAVGRLPARQA